MAQAERTALDICHDIPLPIVKLNRWVLVVGVLSALLLRAPWIISVLFLLLLPAVVGGQRYSPIFQVGRRLFARQNAVAPQEDRRLQRFNNSIAVTLLGLAQLAFLLGQSALGWGLAIAVALAASIALAGFCVGCFLYFQFRLNRYRLFGR